MPPDFDAMWRNIKERLDQPKIYLLENIDTGRWLAVKDKRQFQTVFPDIALRFIGKEAKERATLYLMISQDVGDLMGFVVTEWDQRY